MNRNNNDQPRNKRRSTGCPCEPCGKPIREGDYVILYDDIGEAHADCDSPDVRPETATVDAGEGRMAQVYLLTGETLRLEPISDARNPNSETRHD
jgi:hypothetical protein